MQQCQVKGCNAEGAVQMVVGEAWVHVCSPCRAKLTRPWLKGEVEVELDAAGEPSEGDSAAPAGIVLSELPGGDSGIENLDSAAPDPKL